jgi:hypothetical protein
MGLAVYNCISTMTEISVIVLVISYNFFLFLYDICNLWCTTLYIFLSLLWCRMFYGPGGAYELLAGKDASRALAKMSFEPQDLTGDMSGLTPFELSSLNDWEYKLSSKYVKVGTIRRTPHVEEGSQA